MLKKREATVAAKIFKKLITIALRDTTTILIKTLLVKTLLITTLLKITKCDIT